MTLKPSLIIGAIVMALLTSTVAAVFGGNENEDELESPELIQAKQEHSFSLTGNNCVSVGCVKEKIRYLCETGQQPRWIDCIVIQHCLDLEKQQSMYCAGGLLSSNSDLVKVKFSNNNSKTESCNLYDFGNKTHIRDFLDKSCYFNQQPVVLNGCTTAKCIKKCELEPLPAPPECARMILVSTNSPITEAEADCIKWYYNLGGRLDLLHERAEEVAKLLPNSTSPTADEVNETLKQPVFDELIKHYNVTHQETDRFNLECAETGLNIPQYADS